jgi:hypothetical protein
MIRFRVTWLVLLAVAAGLFLLNWQCWQPGVGGTIGGKPPGTQLERYFGWPATYQAELWRSDDPALAARILAEAPFYDPGDEMSLEYRILGVAAIAVDGAFALLALLAVAVIVECSLRQGWARRQVLFLVGTGFFLLVLWVAGPSVSVSL